MKIWTCFDALPAQTWFLTDDNRIALLNQRTFVIHSEMPVELTRTLRADQCLDDTSGSHADGTITQIWTCTDNDANQAWTLS